MISRSASFKAEAVGLITNSPWIRATRTSEIGPWKGISLTAKAADAASPANASGIDSSSAEYRVTCTKVSA